MNPIIYALLAYALTAVISFMVIGVIVFVNNLMNKSENSELSQAKEMEV